MAAGGPFKKLVLFLPMIKPHQPAISTQPGDVSFVYHQGVNVTGLAVLVQGRRIGEVGVVGFIL